MCFMCVLYAFHGLCQAASNSTGLSAAVYSLHAVGSTEIAQEMLPRKPLEKFDRIDVD